MKYLSEEKLMQSKSYKQLCITLLRTFKVFMWAKKKSLHSQSLKDLTNMDETPMPFVMDDNTTYQNQRLWSLDN